MVGSWVNLRRLAGGLALRLLGTRLRWRWPGRRASANSAPDGRYRHSAKRLHGARSDDFETATTLALRKRASARPITPNPLGHGSSDRQRRARGEDPHSRYGTDNRWSRRTCGPNAFELCSGSTLDHSAFTYA